MSAEANIYKQAQAARLRAMRGLDGEQFTITTTTVTTHIKTPSIVCERHTHTRFYLTMQMCSFIAVFYPAFAF